MRGSFEGNENDEKQNQFLQCHLQVISKNDEFEDKGVRAPALNSVMLHGKRQKSTMRGLWTENFALSLSGCLSRSDFVPRPTWQSFHKLDKGKSLLLKSQDHDVSVMARSRSSSPLDIRPVTRMKLRIVPGFRFQQGRGRRVAR